MKLFKTILTFGMLLTSTLTVQANDYALLDTYPLLNDMKMVQKEQQLLNNMRELIVDHNHNNKSKLREQKRLFTAIITGLSQGDATLGLHGTELPYLKNQINTIALIWSQEKVVMSSAHTNKMYEENAVATINNLSKHLKMLNGLYKQSYTRYKKNSVMKSLVRSYMQDSRQSEPRYAMNHISK